MSELQGRCDQRFERVAQTLAAHLRSGKEVGASVYANIDGEDVIDLWGGWRDKEHSAPWGEDTIVNVFSGSKTITSIAVLMLADRGLLDLDAPVARYWPEFAQGGKDKALVRHLLSHSVGVPAWEPPFTLEDAMDIATSTARLAAQAPWWEPGTRASYHASSFGHLNAELVRRVSGKTLSAFIADEVARPARADFVLGLADADFARVATVYPADEEGTPAPAKASPSAIDPGDPLAVERAISARTRLGSFSGQKRDPLLLFNSPEWRRTTFGGSSGHANARGLGRIMSALALDGVTCTGARLLSPPTIANIFREQFHGIDSYYMKPIRWGIGYALAPLEHKERGPLPFMRPGPRTCYWYGTGGALSMADVERRITFTYTMNQCQVGRHQLNGQYYDAFYDSL
jgi:CubicO group peptidase (beta-lactamase class C family)